MEQRSEKTDLMICKPTKTKNHKPPDPISDRTQAERQFAVKKTLFAFGQGRDLSSPMREPRPPIQFLYPTSHQSSHEPSNPSSPPSSAPITDCEFTFLATTMLYWVK